MKLSDAIEAGWQVVPRVKGHYQFLTLDQGVTGVCAVGAACYAVAPGLKLMWSEQAIKVFPQLSEVVQAPYPGGYTYEGPLEGYLIALNDQYTLEDHEIVAAVRNLGY